MENEKVPRILMTPVGAIKTPCDPKCQEIQTMSNVAELAVEKLSPNAEGLRFLALIHEAHYKSCTRCQESNPNPERGFTPEEQAEIQRYDEMMGGVIQALLGQAPQEEDRNPARFPPQKRQIGFMN